MIAGGEIVDLDERIDVTSVHVYAPSPLIFLCGGPTAVEQPRPISLRGAFTRIYGKPGLSGFNTVTPEDFKVFAPHGRYTDILTFEAEFAEIVDLVVLFSESYGSVAELGAFSMVEEIAVRLLVVMDDDNYKDDSFVKLGPVRFLENKYGGAAVCVVNRGDIKIASIKDVSGIDLTVFEARMVDAITKRKADYREKTTFNANRPGHIIKFIVGLIQHYAALTIDEIDTLLYSLGIKVEYHKITDYLLCAVSAEWIRQDKRGVETYYCARPDIGDAVKYRLRKHEPFEDRERWRVRVVEYWQKHDATRFSCIQDSIKSGR